MKKNNIYEAIIHYDGREFRFGPFKELYGPEAEGFKYLDACNFCPFIKHENGMCNISPSLRNFIKDYFYNSGEFCIKDNVFIEIIKDTLIDF